jgi:hypothetical protein
MRKILFAASAAIAALSMPALAQGHGQGQGQGQGQGRSDGAAPEVTIPASPNANDNARGQVQTDVRAGTDSRASERAQERTGASVGRTRDDADDTPDVDVNHRVDVDVDDNDGDNADDNAADRSTPRYGGDVCPPGLSGRDPACVPPGQANQTFTLGQTLPENFRFYTDLNGIPEQLRAEVPTQFQTDAYRYFYNGDTIYVVTRADSTVAAAIDLDD